MILLAETKEIDLSLSKKQLAARLFDSLQLTDTET